MSRRTAEEAARLRAEVVRLRSEEYLGGTTIARMVGVPESTVHWWLTSVPALRRRDVVRPDVVRLYVRHRYPMRQVARMVGVSRQTVARALADAGVAIEPCPPHVERRPRRAA